MDCPFLRLCKTIQGVQEQQSFWMPFYIDFLLPQPAAENTQRHETTVVTLICAPAPRLPPETRPQPPETGCPLCLAARGVPPRMPRDPVWGLTLVRVGPRLRVHSSRRWEYGTPTVETRTAPRGDSQCARFALKCFLLLEVPFKARSPSIRVIFTNGKITAYVRQIAPQGKSRLGCVGAAPVNLKA